MQIAPGVTSLGFGLVLAYLADRAGNGELAREQARLGLAFTGVLAGATYLVSMAWIERRKITISMPWLAASFVLARLFVWSAPPLLETDFYRYLWDGATSIEGINPYAHSPSDVLTGKVDGPDAGVLSRLAARSGPVLGNVNHPDLTTIYPPVAQSMFALAAWIDPFGVLAWRLVLLGFDALTLVLVMRLLRALDAPVARIGWYAWNPLLLREIHSALHMDVLVLPILVGALLFAVRRRTWISAAVCVIGSAVKVWPIVLVPLMMRRARMSSARQVAGVVGLATLCAVVWWPVVTVLSQPNSGFSAYGQGWQNNDGFFRAGIWLSTSVLTRFDLDPWLAHPTMRVVSAMLVGVVVIAAAFRLSTAHGLLIRCQMVVSAMFLLSPTQFPWYWLWTLPLLAVRPHPAMLLYTALLPLYYAQEFSPAIPWLEHAPVWGLLLFITAHRFRRVCAKPASESEVAHA